MQKSSAHLRLLKKFLRPSAHLRLLKKFLRPQVAVDFSKSDQKVIKSFLDEGLLVHADLSEYLPYEFKAAELKSMLKQRGLPISGRKSDLISRLVQADPEWMRETVIEDLAYKFKVAELRSMLKQRGLPVSGRKSDLISRLVQADPEGVKNAIAATVLQCSERGRETVNQYLAREKKTKRLMSVVIPLIIFTVPTLCIILDPKTTLTCKRVEPSLPVTCELVDSVLQWSPAGREFELRGASLVEVRDSEGDIHRRVVLQTSSGDIRLETGVFASEYGLASYINNFVENPEETRLTYQYAIARQIGYITWGVFILGFPFLFLLQAYYKLQYQGVRTLKLSRKQILKSQTKKGGNTNATQRLARVS